MGFPDSSDGKESACKARDQGLIPGGRYPGEGNSNSPQDSCLKNSMDRGIHGVAKSWTQVSNFHFHFPLKWSKEAQLSGQAEYLQEEVEFLMVETLAPSNLNC